MSANSARILQKAALTFDKTAVLPLVVGKAKQPGVIPQHPRDQPVGSEGSRFACLNRGPPALLLHRRVNQASFPGAGSVRRRPLRKRTPESQPIQQAPDVIVLAVGPYHGTAVSLQAERLLAHRALVFPGERPGVPLPAHYITSDIVAVVLAPALCAARRAPSPPRDGRFAPCVRRERACSPWSPHVLPSPLPLYLP